jgi:hypothetical protein
MAFKLALLFGVIAFASACSYAVSQIQLIKLMFHNSFKMFCQPGTTVTTVTTAVTTVSADEGEEGILSSHDRSVIRKTWDQAKRDGDVAPQILFRFVKAHPEYQKMFSKFANVPQNELLSNGNFLAQAYTILAGLNVAIQSLSSQELMAGQLNALGAAHQPRSATPIMFEVDFSKNDF